MSTEITAYHFYGVHIPDDLIVGGAAVWEEAERLDEVIKDQGLGSRHGSVSVGHLSAGAYDRNELFLCMSLKGLSGEVRIGEQRRAVQLPDTRNWDLALRLVAESAGYDWAKLLPPCWMVVVDES